MPGGRLLLLSAALCAAAVSGALAKALRPAKGYYLFGPKYCPIFCELPSGWKVRLFPRPSKQGEHILFTTTEGQTTLAAASYTDMHPKLPTAERYLTTQTKGAEVRRIVVGRNRRLARSYERKTGERRDVFVVLPRVNTRLYVVLRYSAPPASFEKHYPAFQHMLDTWLFKTGDPSQLRGQ
ncbi:MAG: hypothetical protein HY553_23370 [Elusimicrobia bacterium]|nr:hypothetical protein [Elusimicrobiota bacterium]